MKSIILIHPALDFEDNYPCSWIPYSVLSIASAIPEDRFNVSVYDEHTMKREEIIRQSAEYNPFVVGISIMTGGGQIERALYFAKYYKDKFPNTIVVFGGPHANVLPKQTIECNLIDYVVSGPGQNAFVQLIEALSDGRSVEGIDGVYYRDKNNDKVVIPDKRKATISKLHSYKFDMVQLEPYIRFDSTIADRTLNYIASQGCPYSCGFCYECSYEKKYYTMELENIQKDIDLFVNKYNVNGIKFYDADFFVNTRKAVNIMEILKRYNLAWAASIHPKDIIKFNKNSQNSLLKNIRNSNCKRLLMGMESGSNHVLKDIVNKHVTTDELLEVAQAIGKYDIIGSYTFMVGYPDETIDEQEETFDLIKKVWKLNAPIETKVHIYIPYPGTPLYDRAIELGFRPPSDLKSWSYFNYYKAMTPWTDENLERRAAEFTRMIDKNM